MHLFSKLAGLTALVTLAAGAPVGVAQAASTMHTDEVCFSATNPGDSHASAMK